MFAFFACFILFTPPWQPNTNGGIIGGGNANVNIYNMPIDIPQGPQGRLTRTIKQITCPNGERNQTDDRDCCVCPGDLLYQIPPLPSTIAAASVPVSAATSSTPSSKEQSSNVIIDSNGNTIAVPVDATVVSSSVTDTVNATLSSSLPQQHDASSAPAA
jgi:hypothetical protein